MNGQDCRSTGNRAWHNAPGKTPEKIALNDLSTVRRTVAVVSGKGGVGKSTVTALLAVLARRMGLRVGVLDADLTGPSVPRAFGLTGRVQEGPDGLFPIRTKTGIEVMSMGLLLPQEDSPVIWRGPVLAGTVRQFFSKVIWDDLDVLFVDCPPGTGDVPLTVLGELPVDTAVMVATPQDLVSMIVEKAFRMAHAMQVPVAGLVENMSYYICPCCGKAHALFGESRTGALTAAYGVDTVVKLPITPKLSGAGDCGTIELFEGDWLDALAEKLFGDLI